MGPAHCSSPGRPMRVPHRSFACPQSALEFCEGIDSRGDEFPLNGCTPIRPVLWTLAADSHLMSIGRLTQSTVCLSHLAT